MLKPFKIVDTSVFAILVKYEIDELKILKKEKFQVFTCNKETLEDEWLLDLSVEELRYCCGFSQALLQAVWDYYDYGDTKIEDILFVGIPKVLDNNELIRDFNTNCSLAIAESNNFDDTLDAIEDQLDMLKNEISIYRIARKIKLFKGAN